MEGRKLGKKKKTLFSLSLLAFDSILLNFNTGEGRIIITSLEWREGGKDRSSRAVCLGAAVCHSFGKFNGIQKSARLNAKRVSCAYIVSYLKTFMLTFQSSSDQEDHHKTKPGTRLLSYEFLFQSCCCCFCLWW